MAKRFTATEKWNDIWFSSLTKKQKLFWVYILDNCDNAGIWEKNLRLASFHIGEEITDEFISSFLSDKIIFIDSNKIFLPNFISFQYGELNGNSLPHKSVITKLEKYGIDIKTLKINNLNTITQEYSKGSPTLKDKEKDKDKEKEEGKKNEKIEFSEIQLPKTFSSAELQDERMKNYPQVKKIQTDWNEFAAKNNLAQISAIPSWRLANILTRLKEPTFDFGKILLQVKKSPFLLGKSETKWKVNFDKLTDNEKFYVQVLEGIHAREPDAPPQKAPPMQDSAKIFVAFFCECGSHSNNFKRSELEINIGKSITCPECKKRYEVKEILEKAINGRADFIENIEN